MRHGRNASVRRLDHLPVVCTTVFVFDPIQLMMRGDLKEMEVHHTHSFICLMYPSLRVNTLSFTANILAQDARRKVAAALLLVSSCFGGITHSSIIYIVQFIQYSIYIYIYQIFILNVY